MAEGRHTEDDQYWPSAASLEARVALEVSKKASQLKSDVSSESALQRDVGRTHAHIGSNPVAAHSHIGGHRNMHEKHSNGNKTYASKERPASSFLPKKKSRPVLSSRAPSPHFCVFQGDGWGISGWSLEWGCRKNRWDTLLDVLLKCVMVDGQWPSEVEASLFVGGDALHINGLIQPLAMPRVYRSNGSSCSQPATVQFWQDMLWNHRGMDRPGLQWELDVSYTSLTRKRQRLLQRLDALLETVEPEESFAFVMDYRDVDVSYEDLKFAGHKVEPVASRIYLLLGGAHGFDSKDDADKEFFDAVYGRFKARLGEKRILTVNLCMNTVDETKFTSAQVAAFLSTEYRRGALGGAVAGAELLAGLHPGAAGRSEELESHGQRRRVSFTGAPQLYTFDPSAPGKEAGSHEANGRPDEDMLSWEDTAPVKADISRELQQPHIASSPLEVNLDVSHAPVKAVGALRAQQQENIAPSTLEANLDAPQKVDTLGRRWRSSISTATPEIDSATLDTLARTVEALRVQRQRESIALALEETNSGMLDATEEIATLRSQRQQESTSPVEPEVSSATSDAPARATYALREQQMSIASVPFGQQSDAAKLARHRKAQEPAQQSMLNSSKKKLQNVSKACHFEVLRDDEQDEAPEAQVDEAPVSKTRHRASAKGKAKGKAGPQKSASGKAAAKSLKKVAVQPFNKLLQPTVAAEQEPSSGMGKRPPSAIVFMSVAACVLAFAFGALRLWRSS
eukprot:TRINITY_DN14170_c0_g1_i1.p1 TRINITY_DN14170_c0_g1~~TRINITY_DN14170_c0_g1_i1.p1  ORF type:complete len:739 (+),score=151.09 TRINITY_DN14170_c0_g1_i1:84-2300(+)